MVFVSTSQREQWPDNPLVAARKAFVWLTAGPHPVSIDGREFDELPNRLIPVDELRDLLLRRECPRPVWDQVWSHVISRSRAEGGTWTVVAVGLALPMLTPMAARLTNRYRDDPRDICAEILRGFLDALQTVDLSKPCLVLRLWWAAYRAGHRAVTEALNAPTPGVAGAAASEPTPPSGHPDLVLARAVAVGVLTPTEAELIGATRLEDLDLTDWPRPSGLSYKALSKRRRKAEDRLVAWIAESADGLADSDPTADLATARLSGSTTIGPAHQSRTVAKKVDRHGANQAPKSGLPGCG